MNTLAEIRLTKLIKSQLGIFVRLSGEEFSLLVKENPGSFLLIQCVSNGEIMSVTRRIRQYVINGNATEAWQLKNSYRDALALEAVAAAIIAQIAITMLSLSNFDNVHWSATAFAYTSLVCGILSTYFAFLVQQRLSDLHGPNDVHSWLVTTRQPNWLRQLLLYPPEHSMPHSIEERVPSLRAAAALTTPSKLLRFSIVALFVALGIYLGCVYHAGLGNLDGGNANLGVLLFFVVITTSVLCDAFLAMASMFAYQSCPPDEDVQVPGGSEAGNAADLGNTIGAPSDTIRNALESSIRAQKESLKSQKALLELVNVQSAS